METMKDDMGGAASILATMKAIAILKPKINVIAAIPSSENMPSGSATKPGDVLTHRGGTTSEVLNTDAEGRLVLADALAYLAEKKPKAIIDTATLTGACMVALGDQITGAMGNDDALCRAVAAAGDAAGETIWQLPLHDDYRRLIDSTVADMKNIGERYGGAISAAWFLAEFVGDTPWVHLDIAGPAWAEKVNDLGPKGGTGAPVRTLVRYLLDQSALTRCPTTPPNPRFAPAPCWVSTRIPTTPRSPRAARSRSGSLRAARFTCWSSRTATADRTTGRRIAPSSRRRAWPRPRRQPRCSASRACGAWASRTASSRTPSTSARR